MNLTAYASDTQEQLIKKAIAFLYDYEEEFGENEELDKAIYSLIQIKKQLTKTN